MIGCWRGIVKGKELLSNLERSLVLFGWRSVHDEDDVR